MINFLFVTRVWTPEIDKWLCKQEETHEQKLDLIIMNSLLWDVNRWGPNYVSDYKKNLAKLLARVKTILADDGMFIWLTAQPGSPELNSQAMETSGLEFQKTTTRFNVIQANFYTAHEVSEAGFDVIDLHYYFMLQTFRRNRDGIHWSPEANRYVTNLVLTHISLANDIPLPNRNVTDYALKRVIYMSELAKGNLSEEEVKEKIQHLDNIAKNMVRQGGQHEVQLPPVDQLNNNDLGPNPFPNMQMQQMQRMQQMEQHQRRFAAPNPYLQPVPNIQRHMNPWQQPRPEPWQQPFPWQRPQPGPWQPQNQHPYNRMPIGPPMVQSGYERSYGNVSQQQQLPWDVPPRGPQFNCDPNNFTNDFIDFNNFNS